MILTRATLLFALLVAGCFPYRESWRPAVDGVVVDSAARPLGGARVEACSASRWNPSKCRARASVLSDGEGRFRLQPHVEWEWCCFGEAPMPFTVLAACTDDGRSGGARLYGRNEAPLVVTVGGSIAHDDRDWVARACSRR